MPTKKNRRKNWDGISISIEPAAKLRDLLNCYNVLSVIFPSLAEAPEPLTITAGT